ncbi:TnsD family Tn7-like transposition protein [Paenibacillus alginolyticus]|uniref:TnsD family transposase n=1 Tax=Paenibacillus alginolyticus TaxID=59839 RepID=A0ABT4GN28_9BACL|nr:TnsD family Tn7-like transposition protein [Paenibacillus alginolyticus]MCY9697587.1 TnsD family transposase [Paenibacillus alginolyticus]MEC0143345.1 TnsD family Tn7-like transposition protein [Paenibacillus alginolyticus]
MKPYPDEILVSVLARYHDMKGQMHTKPILRDIYGVGHKKTSVDLPSSVGSIISHGIIDSTVDEVIEKCTLFPFYRPFLSESQAAEVYKLMMGDGGSATHLTSGIMPSVVRNSDSLRLCPVCLTDDIQNNGEPYWHREHQLPGMIICSIHEIELITECNECAEPFSHSRTTKGVIVCPLFCRNGHDLSTRCVDKVDDHLLQISRGITDLFQLSQIGKVPSNIRELYLVKLSQLNLCTVNKSIRQKELHSKFLAMFTIDILNKLGVPKPTGQHSWLSRIFRKPRFSFHPLLHTLVIQFLWGGIKLLPSNAKNLPFGIGPWPCLNRMTSHYGELTIKDIKITQCSDTKRPVGSFKCKQCGFHYSRRGPDIVTNDIFTYGRVKDFGQVWRDKADNLLEKGGSIRSIARELHVDSKTVNLYIKKRHTEIAAVESSEQELRRNRFMKSIKDSDMENYDDLKHRNSKDYRWLYKNDREWLKKLLPARPKRLVHQISRVNWNQRDKQLVKEINQAILTLRMGDHKPERITISRIGRTIGKLALLERHLDKLPFCYGLLKVNLETEEQHQIRKIDWAVQKIKQQGDRPVKWKILRYSGIRIISTDVVNGHLYMRIGETIDISPKAA